MNRSLRVFTSSDPMRHDRRRIHPQSKDDARLMDYIRQRLAERRAKA